MRRRVFSRVPLQKGSDEREHGDKNDTEHLNRALFAWDVAQRRGAGPTQRMKGLGWSICEETNYSKVYYNCMCIIDEWALVRKIQVLWESIQLIFRFRVCVFSNEDSSGCVSMQEPKRSNLLFPPSPKTERE